MSQRDIRTVASGFMMTESARWHQGALWFVDYLRGNVHRLANDAVETFGGFDRPMSLGFRPGGEMLVADVLMDRVSPAGARRPSFRTSSLHVYRDGRHLHTADLSEFGAVNDMCVDRYGRAYIDVFRQPPAGGDQAPTDWEPVGQILLFPPEGDPRIVADGIVAANGIGVSPDGRTLVVGETWGPERRFSGSRLFGFDVADDGSLSNRRVITTIASGSCDGLCFDADGAVWLSTAAGGEVQRVLGGAIVDRIGLPDHKWPLACALGGPELRTLYICSVTAPPKGDPEVFPDGWDLTGFREAFIETVEVDVPGVAL